MTKDVQTRVNMRMQTCPRQTQMQLFSPWQNRVHCCCR